MSDLVKSLRELAEIPHDVAGAQDDLRAAAERIEADAIELRWTKDLLKDFATLQRAIVGDTGLSAILHVEKMKEALKIADGAITALENCGVRAPCAQCDNHIVHGRRAVRSALTPTDGGANG